jgi:tetratricopeptide (TPR) repeat protein
MHNQRTNPRRYGYLAHGRALVAGALFGALVTATLGRPLATRLLSGGLEPASVARRAGPWSALPGQGSPNASNLDAAALLSSGDAARRSGNLPHAKRAYVAIRARFSSHPEAAIAALRLGDIEFLELGEYANAALWFATYLREQPDGALAEAAQQRLMECDYRVGDYGNAIRLARKYLETRPSASPDDIAMVILRDGEPPNEHEALAGGPEAPSEH